MFRNLFLKTLRDGRLAIAGWSCGMVLISFYVAWVFPFLNESAAIRGVLDSLPPVIRNLIGKNNPLATPEGFFNLQPFSVFAPLLFLILAISRGSDALAGEEERGTLELLLAAPLARPRLVLEKFAALAVELLVVALALWAGMSLATSIFHIPLTAGRFIAPAGGCFLIGLFFLAVAMLAGAVSGRRRLSASLAGVLAAFTYLFDAYAPMVEALRPFRKFSPFFWYNGHAPLINGFRAGPPLLLFGLTLLLLLLAVLAFQRRQLRS
jgi:ABC-2 type transport system permease protein